MPASQVLHKFKQGTLHSGSKKGPRVTSRKQAIAIYLSEKRAAQKGKKEYQDGNGLKMKRKKYPLKKGA